jgi:hypothetical protein
MLDNPFGMISDGLNFLNDLNDLNATSIARSKEC